jgi:ABC-type amino acid transport substrate-binding protein
MATREDRDLGMTRPIPRRDFISGVAAGAAGAWLGLGEGLAAAPEAVRTPEAPPDDYPPARTGLRGQYPGSFEYAHQARDGGYATITDALDTGEVYDLVVVGAGISGLSAAYFFRQAVGGDHRILLLDNHDDFGGHAKRNEFQYDGRTFIGYGGTQSIETPFPYSFVAKALMRPKRLERPETPSRKGRGAAIGIRKPTLLDAVVYTRARSPTRIRAMRAAGRVLSLLFLLGARVEALDLGEVRARATLRVLAAADEDPAWFSTAPTGEPGFEREIVEGFARLHKLTLEPVPVERWADAIPSLLKGRGDMLVGVNETEERKKLVDFTTELVPARNVVVTRRHPAPEPTIADLPRERIAVVPNTTWWQATVAAGVPASRLVTVADVEGALDVLRTGKASAAVMDIVDFFLQRRRDPELRLGPSLGTAISSAWAVRKGDRELRDALNAYLADLRRSPAWSRLLVKYFGDDALAILGRDRTDSPR